jgi:hypothetical protein
MSTTVTLNVFSGRAIPRWSLSDKPVRELDERVHRLQSFASDIRRTRVYRGLVLIGDRTLPDPRAVVVRDGKELLARRSRQRDAPPPAIAGSSTPRATPRP